MIIRFVLSQRWKKCFYPNETLLIPTISYLHIPTCFKSCKNICIPSTPYFQLLLFRLLSLCPHLFPQGFSCWPEKLVQEPHFTDSSFRFCSPTKRRMQYNLSQNLVLTSICPVFIVKWFRYNQWTYAESHLTFSMVFFSILLLSILYLNPFMSGMHCESQTSPGCLETAGLS